MKVSWTEYERDNFAKAWPCCNIPKEGWAEFDSQGNLVDLSDSAQNLDASGGLSPFLDDLLKAKK